MLVEEIITLVQKIKKEYKETSHACRSAKRSMIYGRMISLIRSSQSSYLLILRNRNEEDINI